MRSLAVAALALLLTVAAVAGPESWKPPLVMLHGAGFAQVEAALGKPASTTASTDTRYKNGKPTRTPVVTWNYGGWATARFAKEKLASLSVTPSSTSGFPSRMEFYFTRDTVFRVAAPTPKDQYVTLDFRRRTPEGFWVTGRASAAVPGGAFSNNPTLGADGTYQVELAVDRFWTRGTVSNFSATYSDAKKEPKFDGYSTGTVLVTTGDGVRVGK